MWSKIIWLWHYVSQWVCTNDDIADFCSWEASPSTWKQYTKQDILDKCKRAWIDERRYLSKIENTSTATINVINDIVNRYWKWILTWIDRVIVSTMTPSNSFPPNAAYAAAYIKEILPEETFPSMDVNDVSNACSGFISASRDWHNAIESWLSKKVLIVASECMSRIPWKKPKTKVLWWDWAWWIILEKTEEEGHWLLWSDIQTHTQYLENVVHKSVFNHWNPLEAVSLKWADTYRAWVDIICWDIKRYLDSNLLTIDSFDWLVTHQANWSMIDEIARTLQVPEYKLLKTIRFFWNTWSASIPLTMSYHQEKLNPWDRILLWSIWAGMTTWIADIVRK